ncbi:hypothetical protein D0962_34950 [Leptolyngbyaceae cyanobacterium CCMR0082]|uniref:Uncharacterized protein n=2 Tax=Adonisia turfae TaxID=2950184 RepID=A0A6M0SHQ7_9CYAN|nr:hypothetical protein [Adonisia turfae]MDV3352080.1 hypothetical protein [Leptothoe sp. LEGE 181152]NEZ57744.1 hypothetical protein [Adonisia turfae CCMR0081]NEZ67894.1 hypothetical protein [Adonisia turfae CCMR0082]
MVSIHQLLNHLIETEQTVSQSDFLAPCVRQGYLRTRVNGLVYTFTLKGWPFEGWGLFRPTTYETVTLVKEAGVPEIAQYLRRLQPFRFYLVHRLYHRSWLAYPINEADVHRQLGEVRPVVVHLVTDAFAFDQVIARWDGNAFWFEQGERSAEHAISPYLCQSLAEGTAPDELHMAGLTPEALTAYSLAIKTGDGNLQHCQEQGDFWSAHWTTADGESHTSTLAKDDLAVISAGICLRDCDRDYDLQSLVGISAQT